MKTFIIAISILLFGTLVPTHGSGFKEWAVLGVGNENWGCGANDRSPGERIRHMLDAPMLDPAHWLCPCYTE